MSGPGKYKRILVFQLNWMGDILFSFPFLETLRRAFPRAVITCAVVPGYSEILKGNPWVDLVMEFDGHGGILSPVKKVAFARALRKERYDVCFFLKPSRSKALIAVLAGIPERIGHAGKGALITKAAEAAGPRAHRADHIMSLARAAGISGSRGKYKYTVGGRSLSHADELLKERGSRGGRIVALNPGGNWPPKRWPAENFTELAKRLLDAFEGLEIMITGSPGDRALAAGIAGEISDPRCYSVAGMTGITELAALFRKSALVISADSGPLHLASATGTSTLGLFGPTSPSVTGPIGTGRNIVIHRDAGCDVPCYAPECAKGYACMRGISVEDVLLEAGRALT